MRRILPWFFLLPACSEASIAPPVLDGDGVVRVRGADPGRPRLRYVDGQLSRNSSCMIRLGNELNPKIPPLYVNGAPLGFC